MKKFKKYHTETVERIVSLAYALGQADIDSINDPELRNYTLAEKSNVVRLEIELGYLTKNYSKDSSRAVIRLLSESAYRKIMYKFGKTYIQKWINDLKNVSQKQLKFLKKD